MMTRPELEKFIANLSEGDRATLADILLPKPNPQPDNHKEVKVCVGELQADIDEEIAPLIHELWKAHLSTVNSCQENQSGIAWIQFATAECALEFLQIVAEREEGRDTLFARITREWDDRESVIQNWNYEVFLHDFSRTDEDDETGRRGEPPDFDFWVSVRFPRADLPVVLEKMVRHNRGNS
jgi:hypothetical protein